MHNSLTTRLHALRRRLRRRALAAGVYHVLAIVGAILLAIGGIDYLIHFTDAGVRIMATLAVATTFIWAIGRYLVIPLRMTPTDVALAQRVERRDGSLNDQLSSAVAFLKLAEDDPGAGSPMLRRAVIASATAESDRIPWRAIAPWRPLCRSAVLLMLTAAVLTGVMFVGPRVAQTAVWRLVNPLGDNPWPRTHYLVAQNVPTRIAAGSTLEVEVIDENGRLPKEATIHYRVQRDDNWEEVSAPMQRKGKSFVARIENVTQQIGFRVTGGDDHSMPWQAVMVARPPSVRSLTITLRPPAYTGYLPHESERHIRAITGTRIGVEGEATTRLSSAKLVLVKDQTFSPSDQDTESVHDAAVSDNRFSIPQDRWTARRSTRYWFELKDTDGLIGGTKDWLSLRVFEDSPPSVAFESPAHDLYVTPAAMVPLEILVKDDLAIRNTVVVVTHKDTKSEETNRFTLYQGVDRIAHKPPDADPTRDPGERRSIEHAWNLAPLGLSPGDELTIYAEATDYRPQTGKTVAPRRIHVISPAELEDRLIDMQSLILTDLTEALTAQRAARSQTESIEIQVNGVRRITAADRDGLHAVEQNQRQVTRLIADRQGGVLLRIKTLLAEMKNNRINNSETARRMDELTEELERLGRDHLPVLVRELTTAIKGAESSVNFSDSESSSDRDDSASFDETVAKLILVGKEQQTVIDSLERLVDDLRQWAGYRRFAREFVQLLAEQEKLTQETRDQLSPVGSGLPVDALTKQQRANLEKASIRQRELARRTAALGPPMAAAIEQLSSRETTIARTLEDGLELMRKRNVDGQMREAAQHIGGNRLGRALEQQVQIAECLREIITTLRDRHEDGLSKLVKKLQEAERELETLRKQLQGLRQKSKSTYANKPSDDATDDKAEQEYRRQLERLTREQQELQQEIERLARKLKRLSANRASRSTKQAASRLDSKQPTGRNNGAGQGGEDLEHIQQAESDLKDAQQQLAKARQKAEQDLANQRLAKLETTIQSLIDRQENVLSETRRLQTIIEEAGHLSFGQIGSVRTLADEQALLRDETNGRAKSIGGIGVIQLTLRKASDNMDAAAARLKLQKTGKVTQVKEKAAIARLEQLLAAIANPNNQPDEDGNNQGGGAGGGQGGGEQGRNLPLKLAEIKLLRHMQFDLRQRTITTEKQLADDANAGVRDAYQRLGDEQNELAQLVLALIERASTDAPSDIDTDNGESLPDLDEELEQDLELPMLDIQGSMVLHKDETEEDLSPLDQELFESLGEDLGETGEDDAARDPVLRIGERMQTAGLLIVEGDASGKASDLQSKIVEDLDALIDSLKCRKCKSPKNAGECQQQSKRSQPKQPKNAGKPKPGQRSDKPARDSTDRLDQSADQGVDMAEMHDLMKDLWGQLPARTREQMLRSRPEEFLPEYELEIEQYYRRLAEEPE